jgi:molecular chaperone GrpE
MGDGDLVDPESQDVDDVSPPATEADEAWDAEQEGTDDSDAPERASEIDDVTDSIPRPDAAEGPPAAAADVDVDVLIAERDEYRHLAQRVKAEFDNFRRRSAAQAQADAERAAGRLAEALLPVLDAAEAAYLRHPDEVGPLLNQMLTELKKHGLETLDLDGQPFDPEVAEAVAHEPGDGDGPVVTEVLRSGYRWKGRTLRPAMVRTRD